MTIWHSLAQAVCLMLVLEGIMPFLASWSMAQYGKNAGADR